MASTRSKSPRPATRPLRQESRHNPPSAIAIAALILSIFAIVIALYAVYSSIAYEQLNMQKLAASTNTSVSAPQPTLAGIDTPLNNTELSTINNASDSYFEIAGQMYLNGSIANQVLPNYVTLPNGSFVANGKQSVIYLGSITCVFCGENRWAMALALSRFGNFSKLYKGYSAIHDSDVPTLYWNASNYNISAGMDTGSFYSSKYVNFIPFEDEAPITGGFSIQPLQTMQGFVNQTGNSTKISAFNFILGLQNNANTLFQGTPYTIWGNAMFAGADAVDFGNSTPTGATLALSSMTHADVLNQLRTPNDQFAWTEYAAADMYIAGLCKSLNNTAPVCSLPAIVMLEKK